MSLKVSNLSLKPDAEFHLDDVSFEMSKGKIYTVIGRTLSGKTTLLKTIAGLIRPDSGEMSLDKQNAEQIMKIITASSRELTLLYDATATKKK